MKTEDLIEQLAMMPAPPRLHPGRDFVFVVALVTVASAVFLSLAGLRPDLGAALSHPVTQFKSFWTLAFGLTGAISLRPLLRPEGRLGGRGPLLALPPLAALSVLGVALTRTPEAEWRDAVLGSQAVCLSMILVLSLAPLGLLLAFLRKAASPHPALSGALAGLTVAGMAATGYSLFCTEDSPIFFVTWYGLAIAIVTGLGAVLGARLLRW